MGPQRRSALAKLVEQLGSAGIDFQLGGSGLLAALGVPVEVRDLDLIFAEDSQDALRRASGEWWRGPATARPQKGISSSWLVELDVDGVPVDAVGGLGLMIAEELRPIPFRSGPTWRMEGIAVPLAPPGQWVVIYRIYNPERAAMLEKVVVPEEIEEAERELAIAPPLK